MEKAKLTRATCSSCPAISKQPSLGVPPSLYPALDSPPNAASNSWNMINLETVATGIDCTKEDSLSWTVPDVTIYANVYFVSANLQSGFLVLQSDRVLTLSLLLLFQFQFTMGGDVSTAVWTTRFPIASTSGVSAV